MAQPRQADRQRALRNRLATAAGPATVPTTVQVVADSVQVDAQSLTLDPNSRSEVTFTVPTDTRGLRVILATTDSLPTGKRVDLVAPPAAPAVILESLDVPPYVRAGDSFAATLTIGATAQTSVGLQVQLDGRPIINRCRWSPATTSSPLAWRWRRSAFIGSR